MNISAVIPAYNEEKTVGNVIDVLKKVDLIDEIIVVSDGSKDNTAEIARKHGAKVIELKENVGKGGAIKKGLDCSNGDIILVMDADLVGLREEHVLNLLEPVIQNEAEMTIGIFKSGRLATDLAQKIAPYLSGQRAIKKDVLKNISNIDITRYGFEVSLTKYAIKNNIKMKEVPLFELTHIMKEEKLGFLRGFLYRLKMYYEILKNLKIG